MNMYEFSYDMGYRCGQHNMPVKYITQIAYEFKDPRYIVSCLDGWNDAINKMRNLQ